jgi:hypothetical protein
MNPTPTPEEQARRLTIKALHASAVESYENVKRATRILRLARSYCPQTTRKVWRAYRWFGERRKWGRPISYKLPDGHFTNAIEVGDLVVYSVEFLALNGLHTGERGLVTNIVSDSFKPSIKTAEIKWDSPDMHPRMLISNLMKVGSYQMSYNQPIWSTYVND